MGARQKRTIGRPGVVREGEQWTPFPFAMVMSPAFRALNSKAIQLYFVARKQEATAKAHAERKSGNLAPDLYPVDKWDFLEDEANGKQFPFYLNKALLVRDKGSEGKAKPRDWYGAGTNGQRLYADNKSLIEDRQKLVEYGFLEGIPVGAGSGTGERTKGVYVLSDRWRKMTEQDIERIKEDLKK